MFEQLVCCHIVGLLCITIGHMHQWLICHLYCHQVTRMSTSSLFFGQGSRRLYFLPWPCAMLLNSTSFSPLPSSFMFVDCCVICCTCRGATIFLLKVRCARCAFSDTPKTVLVQKRCKGGTHLAYTRCKQRIEITLFIMNCAALLEVGGNSTIFSVHSYI